MTCSASSAESSLAPTAAVSTVACWSAAESWGGGEHLRQRLAGAGLAVEQELAAGDDHLTGLEAVEDFDPPADGVAADRHVARLEPALAERDHRDVTPPGHEDRLTRGEHDRALVVVQQRDLRRTCPA